MQYLILFLMGLAVFGCGRHDTESAINLTIENVTVTGNADVPESVTAERAKIESAISLSEFISI